jgi:PAS domain S-box-containing protein
MSVEDKSKEELLQELLELRKENESLKIAYQKDIAQVKQAESALAVSEKKFRSLFDSTSEAVMLLNEKGFFACNKATLDIFGCSTEEEFCSKHPGDLSPAKQPNGEDSNILADKTIFIAKEKGSYRFEWLHRRIDNGNDFSAEVLINALELNGEQILQATVRDISARKAAEAALRESERKYRLLVNSANEAIVVVQDGVCKLANPMSETIIGYSVEHLAATPFPAFIYPEDRTMVIENHQRRLRGEVAPTHYIFRLLNKYGIIKWVYMNSVLIDWDGSPATLNFLTDITERKQIEDTLRKSEQKYRLLVECANEAIVVVQDGMLRLTNPISEILTGYSADYLASTPFPSFIYPEDKEAVISNHIKRLKGEDAPNQYIFRLINKDGSIRWVYMNSVLIDWDGSPATLNFLTDITERKKVEEALQMSNKRYETLFNKASDGILHLSTSGKILGVNESYCKMHGYNIMEILQMDILNLEADDSFHFNSERLNRIMEGEAMQFEVNHFHKDGHIIILEVSASRICIGDEIFIQTFNRDITDRKKAEELLIRQNREIESQYEEYMQLNEILRQTNYSLELEKEKSNETNIKLQMVNEELNAHYLEDQIRNEEIQAKLEEAVESRTHQLLESEAKFRSVFNNSTLGIYRTTPDGKILIANPALINLLKYDSFEELSQLNLEAEQPYQNYSRQEFKKQIEKSGRLIGLEGTWLAKDGTEIYIRESVILIRDNEGKQLYYDGVVEDISEKRKAEIALIESENKLKESNAAKDKFFSIIAHDLKNPLTAMIMKSEMAYRYFDKFTVEEQIDNSKKLHVSAKHLHQLLENLLNWSRSQTGKIEFEPSEFDIYYLIKENIKLLENNISQKKIQVNFESLADKKLFADKNMVSTILRNLISNAIKFTSIGGNVEVGAKVKPSEGLKPSEDYIVYIKDNGIGMSADTISNIFKLDQKVSRQGTEGESGTGLGLLLCKEFIEKHDGKIWVESEVEKGSTFYFSLPKK